MKDVAGITFKYDGYPELSDVRCMHKGSEVTFPVQRWAEETSMDGCSIGQTTSNRYKSSILTSPKSTEPHNEKVHRHIAGQDKDKRERLRKNPDGNQDTSTSPMSSNDGKEADKMKERVIKEEINGNNHGRNIVQSHWYIDWQGMERKCTTEEPSCEYHIQLLIDFHSMMAKLRTRQQCDNLSRLQRSSSDNHVRTDETDMFYQHTPKLYLPKSFHSTTEQVDRQINEVTSYQDSKPLKDLYSSTQKVDSLQSQLIHQNQCHESYVPQHQHQLTEEVKFPSPYFPNLVYEKTESSPVNSRNLSTRTEMFPSHIDVPRFQKLLEEGKEQQEQQGLMETKNDAELEDLYQIHNKNIPLMQLHQEYKSLKERQQQYQKQQPRQRRHQERQRQRKQQQKDHQLQEHGKLHKLLQHQQQEKERQQNHPPQMKIRSEHNEGAQANDEEFISTSYMESNIASTKIQKNTNVCKEVSGNNPSDSKMGDSTLVAEKLERSIVQKHDDLTNIPLKIDSGLFMVTNKDLKSSSNNENEKMATEVACTEKLKRSKSYVECNTNNNITSNLFVDAGCRKRSKGDCSRLESNPNMNDHTLHSSVDLRSNAMENVNSIDKKVKVIIRKLGSVEEPLNDILEQRTKDDMDSDKGNAKEQKDQKLTAFRVGEVAQINTETQFPVRIRENDLRNDTHHEDDSIIRKHEKSFHLNDRVLDNKIEKGVHSLSSILSGNETCTSSTTQTKYNDEMRMRDEKKDKLDNDESVKVNNFTKIIKPMIVYHDTKSSETITILDGTSKRNNELTSDTKVAKQQISLRGKQTEVGVPIIHKNEPRDIEILQGGAESGELKTIIPKNEPKDIEILQPDAESGELKTVIHKDEPNDIEILGSRTENGELKTIIPKDEPKDSEILERHAELNGLAVMENNTKIDESFVSDSHFKGEGKTEPLNYNGYHVSGKEGKREIKTSQKKTEKINEEILEIVKSPVETLLSARKRPLDSVRLCHERDRMTLRSNLEAPRSLSLRLNRDNCIHSQQSESYKSKRMRYSTKLVLNRRKNEKKCQFYRLMDSPHHIEKAEIESLMKKNKFPAFLDPTVVVCGILLKK